MSDDLKELYQDALDAIRNDPMGRVHGNGFIQIDIEPGRRLHIWGDPRIPCQKVSTQIHNHRFGFVSTILHGVMHNIRYTLHKGTRFQLYEAVAREGEDTALHPVEGCLVNVQDFEDAPLMVGDTYYMAPGGWHETTPYGLTVTLMMKTETHFDLKAQVLCEVGKTPDNEFNRNDEDNRLASADVIFDAAVLLQARFEAAL